MNAIQRQVVDDTVSSLSQRMALLTEQLEFYLDQATALKVKADQIQRQINQLTKE